MTYGWLLILVLLSGCAKHGYMIETDPDFKGEITIGWGPTSIINADAKGGMRMCVPSKTALKEEQEAGDNWCRSWMEKKPESMP